MQQMQNEHKRVTANITFIFLKLLHLYTTCLNHR